jgi:hypothetical protein
MDGLSTVHIDSDTFYVDPLPSPDQMSSQLSIKYETARFPLTRYTLDILSKSGICPKIRLAHQDLV